MQKSLIQRIEIAFNDVPRGKVGIREADAYDSRVDEYEDSEGIRKASELDTETDWKDIPNDVLSRNPSIFSCFDPQGFRFILPAIMRWSLIPEIVDEWDVTGSLLQKLYRSRENLLIRKLWQKLGGFRGNRSL